MESRGEISELQQLVSSDAENDDSTIQEDPTDTTESKVMSPIRSAKVFSSSGNTSHSSVTRSAGRGQVGSTGGSKIAFINERKPFREPLKASTARPRNPHKVPDVRHMERALLGLLADFHSGKLRAFGGGNTMDQMTNIREQQEKLAKLHFDLAGSANVPSLSEDSLKSSQNTMSQLIQRLEQLSISIEALHSNSTK
ncbi:uncharacterized protein [Euwallacea fornicatus]|uniref:uncharacterized protein isoform X3 n=1 Tax=Euwallacea fornicatus TaxID=995702 RepID=UPI00338F83D4